MLNAVHWVGPQVGVPAYTVDAPGSGKTSVHQHAAKVMRRVIYGSLIEKLSRYSVTPSRIPDEQLDELIDGKWFNEEHKSLAERVPSDAEYFMPIILSQWLPEDLGGYKVKGQRTFTLLDGTKVTKDTMESIPAPEILIADLVPRFVFIDEFGDVTPDRQSAAQEQVRDGFRASLVYAAGNPPEFATNGSELSDPMINRVVLTQWESYESQWRQGIQNGFEYPEPEIPVVDPAWRSFTNKWGSLINQFTTVRRDLKKVNPGAEGHGKPFPSDRSWENFCRLMGGLDTIDGNRQHRVVAANGTIGEGASAEFWAWMDNQDIPDPEDILKNPGAFSLPGRGDLDLVVVDSVAEAVTKNQTIERWEAAVDFLEHVYPNAKELCQHRAKRYFKAKPEGHSLNRQSDVWKEFQSDRTEILAGIMG